MCWDIYIGSVALLQVSPVSDSELQTHPAAAHVPVQSPRGGHNAPYSLMFPALCMHTASLPYLAQLLSSVTPVCTVYHCLHTPAVLY